MRPFLSVLVVLVMLAAVACAQTAPTWDIQYPTTTHEWDEDIEGAGTSEEENTSGNAIKLSVRGSHDKSATGDATNFDWQITITKPSGGWATGTYWAYLDYDGNQKDEEEFDIQ